MDRACAVPLLLAVAVLATPAAGHGVKPVICDSCTCFYTTFYGEYNKTHTIAGANFNAESCKAYCKDAHPYHTHRAPCMLTEGSESCFANCVDQAPPATNCSTLSKSECPAAMSNITCHAPLTYARLPEFCTSCMKCKCNYALGSTTTLSWMRATKTSCEEACFGQTKGTGNLTDFWMGYNCPGEGTGTCEGPPPKCPSVCEEAHSYCRITSFFCQGGTRCNCRLLSSQPDTAGCTR